VSKEAALVKSCGVATTKHKTFPFGIQALSLEETPSGESRKCGTSVVMDRYVPSGVVYHEATINDAGARSFVEGLNRGMPKPDLLIILEVDAEAASKRGDYGGERNDNVPLQTRVGALFREHYHNDAWYINANTSADEVYEEVVKIINDARKETRIKYYGNPE
jgi:thymidylate kinase